MNSDDELKVKKVVMQIAFLMEHQHILPELKELVRDLQNSDNEYLKGAESALTHLLIFLEQKGN